jgi:hypothetical protein
MDDKLCPHLNFAAKVSVGRMEESGRFMADITIHCADCNEPFHFKGLPCGLDLEGAAVSPDGLEARIAIAPGKGGILGPPSEGAKTGLRGFDIRRSGEE